MIKYKGIVQIRDEDEDDGTEQPTFQSAENQGYERIQLR